MLKAIHVHGMLLWTVHVLHIVWMHGTPSAAIAVVMIVLRLCNEFKTELVSAWNDTVINRQVRLCWKIFFLHLPSSPSRPLSSPP